MSSEHSGNPVIQLCLAGSHAELQGNPQDAAQLYQQAWEKHTNAYEACIAAHYLARLQASPADVLSWNQVALEKAALTPDERVNGFYPSLYLNLGQSHERLDQPQQADRFYRLALQSADALPNPDQAEMFRQGILRNHPQLAIPQMAETESLER